MAEGAHRGRDHPRDPRLAQRNADLLPGPSSALSLLALYGDRLYVEKERVGSYHELLHLSRWQFVFDTEPGP